MPAMQGILNKSSTNGVSTTEQTQPLRPPKPATRRVIPRFRLPQGFRGLTKWRNRPSLNDSKKPDDRDGRVSGAVRFADEEEPKTEDSFEYRDIDFASDIFDFRIPIPSTTTQVRKPARPPPPPPSPPTSLSKQATTKTVAFSDIPLIDDEEQQQQADQDMQEEPESRPTEVEVTISVVDSPEETPETEDAVQTLTAEERLTKFLRDHEGQELSEADVDELEKLLNETDEAEMVDNAETKENNICSAESQTHFEEKEVVDEVNSEIPVPLIVEEVSIQVEPTGHTDFSVMEFNKIESHENLAPKRVKPIDDGIYEPVGEPLPSCERRCLPKPPDMSGFVPPKASTKVGDPFSWRRRGMRRWDRYGYEKFKQDPYIPATMQIVEGCQQVEHWIMSRQLSPPGYLLGVLGTTRKLKRRKKKKKKPVPIINAVHPPQPFETVCKPVESESFEEKITQMILRETFEELKRNHSLNSEPESSSDVTVVAKEVLVVTSSPPPAIQPEVEILEAKFQTLDKYKIEDVPIKVDVVPVEIKERNVNKVSEVIQGASSPNQMGHVSRKESFLKKERPPRPLPPTPVSVQESKPIRPSRRAKRVSSVDRPSSAAEMAPATVVLSELPFQAQTFPRVKESPKRSVSTEEVQRRIQIQAQQFFRTPRKKELQQLFTSPTQSSGFSSSLFNTTPRRRPRKSHLPPVYTPINKTCPRKKDFGAQTSEDYEIEDEDDRESIPPPPPPKMHHLLMSTIKSSENLTIGQVENHIRTDDEQHYDNDEIFKTTPMELVPSKIEPPVIVEQPIVTKESETAPNSNVSEAPALSSSSQTYPTYIDSILNPSNLPIFKLGSSDVQVALFCGFLPAGGNLPTSLTELPEMTVHRLNVTHLEAAFIKVGQVEAGQMVIQRVDQLNSSSCPTQGGNTSRIDYTEETEHHEPNSSEQQQVEEKILQRESSIVDVNGNDSLMSEKPFNWDENSSWSGRMNPSSSSASYVTCDETIHESLTDSEFSTDIEDEMEREEDEETTTGCSTPTPHEDLDVGQNVDYDLLRQVFAAAVAGSHPNNHDSSQ